MDWLVCETLSWPKMSGVPAVPLAQPDARLPRLERIGPQAELLGRPPAQSLC